MNKTKFMTRIFSAIENGEDKLLEQLDKDIDIAKEDGVCNADQYTITASDDELVLHDKINDEDTLILEDENGETTFSAVDVKGEEKKDEVLPLVEEVPDNKNLSDLNDQELDEQIKIESMTFSKIKKFSLDAIKNFAKGGWRDGKLYIKMGDSDVALDLKNKVAIILDENLSCAIDPKKSFIDNLETVEKFMKENKLKVFSNLDDQIKSIKISIEDAKKTINWFKSDPKYKDNIPYQEERLKKLQNELKLLESGKDPHPKKDYRCLGILTEQYTDAARSFKLIDEVISTYNKEKAHDLFQSKYGKRGSIGHIKVFESDDKEADNYHKELESMVSEKNEKETVDALGFSDSNPTPEQEGVINFLKGFVEEHPGEAKYLVELGAKWGPDNLLEGLNHDAEGDKNFSGSFDSSTMQYITDNDQYRVGDTITRSGECYELSKLISSDNGEYIWQVKACSKTFTSGNDANLLKLAKQLATMDTEFLEQIDESQWDKFDKNHENIQKGFQNIANGLLGWGHVTDQQLKSFVLDRAEEIHIASGTEISFLEEYMEDLLKFVKSKGQRLFSEGDEELYEAHILSGREDGEYYAEVEVFGPATKEKLKEMLNKAAENVKAVNANPPSPNHHEYAPDHIGYFNTKKEAEDAAYAKADELMEEERGYSKKFSKFSPAVAKMFANSYDDPNEVKRNLRKSVKDAIGSLGLSVPYAKFENGHATITMKIHHDKVDDVKKALSGLRSDIGVTCKCSDPSKTDLTWYDLIFIQK